MSPSDEELAAAMADDYEAQQRTKRNRELMNRLIRGEPPDGATAPDGGQPFDMNAHIRRAAGRPYKTKENDA